MNLNTACKPRQSVFDRSRKDVVLNIDDLLKNNIDAHQFFSENFITSGMHTLFDKVFSRLNGHSNQASTFLLSQAMGGGKTHNMIALGLLAKNPELRQRILGDKNISSNAIRVIGFNGRESDAPFGIWGELADQLGKKEIFNDLYSPLSSPGTTAWINLLKGDPIIIFLDELPPYFDNARAKEIGDTTLAHVTNTALSNLMVAVDRPELSNVCIVISDLRATYEDGSNELNRALENLANETNRSALRLEPVNPQGDELYHILRTRLFEELPDIDVIREIAQEYAEAVSKAKQMDITNASPESFAAQIVESYPFHFSIRDLYARFKENPGFQQTRGLIRLMRVIVSDMYLPNKQGVLRADLVKLIHPYDFNLNNEEIQSEIRAINPTLTEAITHDIAKDGHSISEELDTRLSTTSDAQDVAKLILVASLAH
jgi:predicted AAA+ superfamily ATPase